MRARNPRRDVVLASRRAAASSQLSTFRSAIG